MPDKYTLLGIAFLLSAVPFILHAADTDPHKSKDISVRGESQDMPSSGLLEFLGRWETEDGKWIDPTELDSMTLSPREEEKNEKKKP